MKKLLLFPLFAFLLAPFTTTQAQSTDAAIKNTIGIGPRLGYYKANNADEGNFYFGAQSRIRMGSAFGLEGSIEYRAGQEYNVAPNQTVTAQFVPVTGSALLFLPVSKNIAPYGVAGLGAYYTIYDYEGTFSNENDDEFNLGYHLGFGVEFPLSSNAALNFDYRYLFLNSDTNEQDFSGEYSGNTFTAGLMFYL